jgi:hypothetical protein
MSGPIDPVIRFWSHVQGGDVTECWTWRASRDEDGYGRFCPTRHSETKAHRWAYQQLIAELPAYLLLDHLCRNPPCVNPWHLDPVTNAENLARAARFNDTKTHCKHGHEFTEANAYLNSRGRRGCRTCQRRANRDRVARVRATQAA